MACSRDSAERLLGAAQADVELLEQRGALLDERLELVVVADLAVVAGVQLDLGHHRRGEVPQDVDVRGLPAARAGVGDGEDADDDLVGGDQRDAAVRAAAAPLERPGGVGVEPRACPRRAAARRAGRRPGRR